MTNPLRVLDCKKPGCREQVSEAPSIIEHLCETCSDHFSGLREDLTRLDVAFSVNKFMVRGLDYYVRTTFEFVTDELGAQSAVCAGGRYDGLIEMLGGPKVPGIGFAMGLERLVLLLKQKGQARDTVSEIDLFIAGLGKTASDHCFELMHALRLDGIKADMDFEAKSLKSQMKQADRAGAGYVLIVGDQELESMQAPLRNMATGVQTDLKLEAKSISRAIQEQNLHEDRSVL